MATPRCALKGILSLFCDSSNSNNNDPELLTYHPFHDVTLHQTDQLLRCRRRRHRHQRATEKPVVTNTIATTTKTATPPTTQRGLVELLTNMDIILLFFAEARGCAHSIRVRTMVSNFCHTATTTTTTTANDEPMSTNNQNNDNPSSSSSISYCCICILNGPPEESADWKNTYLEGTGFYSWPSVPTVPPNDDDDDNNKRQNNNDNMHDKDDSSSVHPSNMPPKLDRRRSALIQLLSITQVPTLVVMSAKTGLPVTHDGLAMLERQWWNLATTSRHGSVAISAIDDKHDDDDDDNNNDLDQEDRTRSDQRLSEQHIRTRNALLDEWKCGKSGWSTGPWIMHNIVSCTMM